MPVETGDPMSPGENGRKNKPALRAACSFLSSPMSKRNVGGSRASRKRRRAGASYGEMNLDESDEGPEETEDIRVWKITTSETTRLVSATRKTHKHSLQHTSKPQHEEPPPTPTVEEASTPVDPEPRKASRAKVAGKRRRVRVVKENDSVSFVPVDQYHR